MKKVSKLSLTLASIGVFMIGLAGVLQYKAFQIEENTVAYETVTMNDLNAGKVEEVNNKNENNTAEPADESNNNTEVEENTNTEEVVEENATESKETTNE